MTDLSTIRAKVYAAVTEQHVPLLTRYEARLLFGRIQALEEELAMYRRHMQQARHVDMTPDEGMVGRILTAYIDESSVTDTNPGLPPDNPLCIQMNEWQEERNALLRAALALLGEVPDELK